MPQSDKDRNKELQHVLRRSVAPSLWRRLARQFIGDQIRVVNYLLSPKTTAPTTQDYSYTTNEDLWRDIAHERIRANSIIHLDGFTFSEWLPRAPGVFHTSHARRAREEAMQFVRQNTGNNRRREDDPAIILEPRGKLSMIEGGVGCVRRKPLRLGTSGDVWFLGATSSLDVHEGIPIALPNAIYQQVIDRIARGGLRCSLTGTLRFIPSQLVSLYNYGQDIPQVYIEIDRVQPNNRTILEIFRRPGLLVSAAVGFRSSFEGNDSLYAAFVTFSSGHRASLQNALQWLDETYVRSFYAGRVVTDFDEQSTDFAGAVFSLESLLHTGVDTKAARETIMSLSLGRETANQLIKGLTNVTAIYMRVDQMTQSKTINIGAGATVTAPVTIADTITDSLNTIRKSGADPKVKQALERLLQHIKKIESQVPGKSTKSLVKHARSLAKEATHKKPRKRESRSRVASITKAAKAIGSIGKPIIKIASQLLPLLTGSP